MLFSPLLDHEETILSIELGLLQVLFALLVLLGSVHELLLKALFFVLFNDEFVGELMVAILDLPDLALVKLS